MPRLLDTGDRADVIAAAMARIISTRGSEALSMRALSAECGISPASILQHLTNEERVLRVSAQRWTRPGRKRAE
ncbi:TetR family transcriptional regulator [Nocardioides sp.]|jgi:AcrR family transcriptional regulator|uniref:TetR family transcriptional regulator n=1 Tax=Nocardioides sp. TaxID=35761 RepID=UPI0031FF3DA1